jgi:hypothetical protein
MAHSFSVKLTDEITLVLDRVRSIITGKGGRFEGDAACGSFEGQTVVGIIKGEYRCVAAGELEITITDKPFIVPYGSIESEIRRYFS